MNQFKSRRLLLVLVALIVAGFAIWAWFFRPSKPVALNDRASTEMLEAAKWKVPQLRKLVKDYPNDFEARYWLGVALIDSSKSTSELLEAGALLDSIPADATPHWLAVWKRKHLSRLAVTLLEMQNLSAAEDPFQAQLVQRIEQAVLRQSRFTAEQVRSDLTQLRDLLLNRWAYVEDKARQTGKTIEEAYAERVTEIKPEMRPADAVQLLERFMADMSDGHSYLGNLPIERRGLPFHLRDTTEGVVVASVHESCPELHRGDLVKSINGKSIEEWVSRQMSITCCSTAAARRANAIGDMSIRLVRDDGVGPLSSVTVTVERSGESLQLDCTLVPESQWKRPDAQNWLQSKKLPNNIGYVQVSTWAPEVTDASSEVANRIRSEIDNAIKQFEDSEAIILDVRGNPGGYDWLSTWLASHFIEAPYPIYVLRYRNGNEGFGNPEMSPAMSGVAYAAYQGERLKQPIYVLVDEKCFSATDTFLHVLATNLGSRVTLIGRANAAGIGAPNEAGKLEQTGVSVVLSHCKALDCQTKELIEGKPEKIDHEVEWSRADIIEQRDPVLQKALERIAAASSQQPEGKK